MYAQFSNQLIHVLHYAFAFIIVMIIVPRIIFVNKHKADPFEQNVANYIKMVLFNILVGYALIVTKLFEVLSLLAIWAAMIWWKNAKLNKGNRAKTITSISTLFFDYLDGAFKIWRVSLEKGKITLLFWRDSFLERFSSFPSVAELISLSVVLVCSVYYRFYDAFRHAAPAMSDAYVTLAWMKYNSSRNIANDFFHDGIYPQGFHINLALLHKFAAVDELYILKYTGPLNSIFMMLGLYFVVSRLSQRNMAGIVSALVYGLASVIISPNAWERQASTNSQEFAFVFILPSLYFFYRYLQNGKRENFWIGAAGVTVTGLVHTFAQGFMGLGMIALMTAALLLNFRQQFRKVIAIAIAGVVSIAIAGAPLGLGLMMGKILNSSSSEFLVSKVAAKLQMESIRPIDFIALGCLGFIFIFFWNSLKSRKESLFLLFSFFFITGTFIIYEYGGPLTQSTLISSRSGDLWGLMVPFCIGMGWYVLFKPFEKLAIRAKLEFAFLITLTIAVFLYVHPTPIIPYKMENDQSVEQYLRIAKTHASKTWMIYSQKEGYDLVLSNGFHDYVANLLSEYDPTKPPLTKIGENNPDPNLPFDIYIYREKKVFRVSEKNSIFPIEKPIYETREREMTQLVDWVKRYVEAGNEMTVFYEDTNLAIYHIHRIETKQEKNAKIWGNSGNADNTK